MGNVADTLLRREPEEEYYQRARHPRRRPVSLSLSDHEHETNTVLSSSKGETPKVSFGRLPSVNLETLPNPSHELERDDLLDPGHYFDSPSSVMGKVYQSLFEDDSDDDMTEDSKDIWSQSQHNLESDYVSVEKMLDPDFNVSPDFSKSIIRLDRTHNVMKHMGLTVDFRGLKWIKNHMKRLECRHYIHNLYTGQCFCGRDRLLHNVVKMDEDSAKPNYEWNIIEETELKSTNAFGRVLFSNDDHFASRYVRLAEYTPQTQVFKLLTQRWKVKTPGMVVSTIGSLDGFTITRELKDFIKDGIVRAVSKTTGWILTEGVDVGFVKVMGDACHQYGYPFPCIGIASWGKLKHRQKLEFTDRELNRERVAYISYQRDNDSIIEPTESDDGDRFEFYQLETHHTHFLLIDDGITGRGANGDSGFRKHFEDHISNYLKVPIVVVLLQGGLETLRQIVGYLSRDIPVISVYESGGMAFLLKAFYQHLIKKQTAISVAVDGDRDSEVCRCGTDFTKIHLCPELEDEIRGIFYDYKDTEVAETLAIFEKITPLLDEITFYDKDIEFDAAILKSLTSLGKSDYGLRSQLDLSLRWDRLDVARDILKTYDTNSNEDQFVLSLTLFNAIINNRTKFVEFLLNEGANIDDCQGNIEFLFSENVPPHFIRLLEKHSDYEVGYNTPIFVEHIDQLTNFVMGKWYMAQTGCEADPFYEMMLLNCFLLRKDMACIMWSKTEDPVRAGLAAMLLLYNLRSCSAYAIGTDEKISILDTYKKFEELTVGTVNEAYKEDPRACMVDLKSRWKRFNDSTLLNIGWGAHSKKILATRPAQEIIKQRWRGGIRRHVAVWKTLVTSIFPFLLFLPAFIPLRNSIIYETSVDHIVKGSHPKRRGMDAVYQRFKAFYNSPIVKFHNHAISYILFLMLHTACLLQYFTHAEYRTFNGWIILLVITVALYFIEELRQMTASRKGFRTGYFSNSWNRLDLVIYVLYLTSLILWTIDSNPKFYNYSRALMCLNTVFLFTRLLFLSYMDQDMGTLLLILSQMTRDLMNVMFIIVIFISGYGIAIVALIVKPEQFISNNLAAAIFYPYFQLFGELHLEHIFNYTFLDINGEEKGLYLTNAKSNQTDVETVTVIIMIAIYMLAVGIGFVNLLIAMFSDTYRKIKDNQTEVWKYLRYSLCEEYEDEVMPPPFYTPFFYVIKAFYLIRNWRNGSEQTTTPNLVETNEVRLQKWKDNVLRSLMRESAAKFYQHVYPGLRFDHHHHHHRAAASADVLNIRDVVTDVAKPLQERISILAGQLRHTSRKNEFNMKKRRSSVYQQVYGKLKQKLRKSSASSTNV